MKLTDLVGRINTTEPVQSKRTDVRLGASRAGAVDAMSAADRVEISADSKDIQKISELLHSSPDVRMELVAALKEQIERGEYQVDSRKLAEKLINSLLAGELPEK